MLPVKDHVLHLAEIDSQNLWQVFAFASAHAWETYVANAWGQATKEIGIADGDRLELEMNYRHSLVEKCRKLARKNRSRKPTEIWFEQSTT